MPLDRARVVCVSRMREMSRRVSNVISMHRGENSMNVAMIDGTSMVERPSLVGMRSDPVISGVVGCSLVAA
jgi:hypothetical protein